MTKDMTKERDASAATGPRRARGRHVREGQPPVVPAAVSTTLVMAAVEPKFPRYVGD